LIAKAGKGEGAFVGAREENNLTNAGGQEGGMERAGEAATWFLGRKYRGVWHRSGQEKMVRKRRTLKTKKINPILLQPWRGKKKT